MYVFVAATGDELVPLGQPLGPASIPDSNSESIAAQVLGIEQADVTADQRRSAKGVNFGKILYDSEARGYGLASFFALAAFAAAATAVAWRAIAITSSAGGWSTAAER